MIHIIAFTMCFIIQSSLHAMNQQVEALIKTAELLEEKKEKKKKLEQQFKEGSILLYHIEIELKNLELFCKSTPFILKRRVLIDATSHDNVALEILMHKDVTEPILYHPLIKQKKQLRCLNEYFLNN